LTEFWRETDFVKTVSELLIGADRSVDVAAPAGSLFVEFFLSELAPLVDARIPSRMLLYTRDGFRDSISAGVEQSFDHQTLSNWSIKVAGGTTYGTAILVDQNRGLCELDGLQMILNLESLVPARRADKIVEWLCKNFNWFWESSLVYEGLPLSVDEHQQSQILTLSEGYWSNIIARLAQSPELLHDLTSRGFEELVAELLHRQGLEVKLTPRTKDGGYDILAFSRDRLLHQLFLVECKKWAQDKPVGVTIVRALYGVLEHKQASGAMLVTTSTFTKPAIQFQEQHQYRLSLKQFDDIGEWLRTSAGTKLYSSSSPGS
jgi:hypothetical protein